MHTLDTALDAVMQLTPYERETLLEVLQKRMIEEKRALMANEIKEASAFYFSGSPEPKTAAQVITDLHTALGSDV